MNKQMHLHEDTSKPENRVNLALFHLLMIDEFAAFVKSKLKIPAECCIYPAPNLETEEFDTCERPDFKIELDGVLMGYIEVELGNEDQAQLTGYREKIKEPVYSIVGKKSYLRGDLALDEIHEFAAGIIHKYKGGQKYWSLKLLADLINYYVIQGNFNVGNKRSAISEQMRNSALIKALFEYFGADGIIENQKVQRNKIMLNTVTENGFSVRIFSPETGTGGLSVMSRSGGRETIGFPSYQKLCRYLPEKIEFVDKYADLISGLGAPEIMRLDENQLARLELKTVEDNSLKFFDIISELIDARKYAAIKFIPGISKMNDGVGSEAAGEPAEEGNELKHLPTGYLSVLGQFINFIENTSRQKDPTNPLKVTAVYIGKTGRLWSRNMTGLRPNYFVRCSNGIEINNRMDRTGYNKSKCVCFLREEFDKELKKR